MKHISFHFDFVSPYAYLAFEQLPVALKGISYSASYCPVLFAGLLKHHGQLGPAEISAKRDWTYRQVLWLAQSLNIPLQMPISHPFNPLPLLRLAIACHEGAAGEVNRYVCETLFRHVWQGGQDAGNAKRLAELVAQLSPAHDARSDTVKNRLKSNTDQAIALGVFGVPSFTVDDKVFWGLDALPMLRDYLLQTAWFQGGAWADIGHVAVGVSRVKT